MRLTANRSSPQDDRQHQALGEGQCKGCSSPVGGTLHHLVTVIDRASLLYKDQPACSPLVRDTPPCRALDALACSNLVVLPSSFFLFFILPPQLGDAVYPSSFLFTAVHHLRRHPSCFSSPSACWPDASTPPPLFGIIRGRQALSEDRR